LNYLIICTYIFSLSNIKTLIWNLKFEIWIDSIKSAEGSCVLKMGKTSVVCGIKAEVAEPRVDDPKKGYIGNNNNNNLYKNLYKFIRNSF